MHYCYVCSGKKQNPIMNISNPGIWMLSFRTFHLFWLHFFFDKCESSITLPMSWDFFFIKIYRDSIQRCCMCFCCKKACLGIHPRGRWRSSRHRMIASLPSRYTPFGEFYQTLFLRTNLLFYELDFISYLFLCISFALIPNQLQGNQF